MIWCIGFQPDFGWLDAPVFNGRGQPGHVRGVTALPGEAQHRGRAALPAREAALV